jgi:Tfp pilus assembly protein PilZ
MHEHAVRVVPHKAITVAIHDPRQVRSYGVVANISEGGACVLTDASFPLGESLALELGFSRERHIVRTAGYVVWSSGSRNVGALRYGLKWTTGPGDDQLRSLIEQAGRVRSAYRPRRSPPGARSASSSTNAALVQPKPIWFAL